MSKAKEILLNMRKEADMMIPRYDDVIAKKQAELDELERQKQAMEETRCDLEVAIAECEVADNECES